MHPVDMNNVMHASARKTQNDTLLHRAKRLSYVLADIQH
jgi:hypothetical protein